LALKACWYPVAGGAKALCSSWTLAKAVDFAVQAGAQVLNMSLSGPSDGLLGKLLAKAQEHGVIVVAAAAEGSGSPGFPASAPGVIAVVASNSRGAVLLPAWTSRTFVMVAPGVEILTTVLGAGYDFVSGSSFAAAHVSGVVALLREGNPRLSAAAALTLLKETARPVGGDAVAQRAGLVDACAALARLLGNPNCS
jgi:subtilisin family serine protease